MLNDDHHQEHMASNGEALNEYAHNAGMDNPDTAWILHDRDIWLKNPYYAGPPQLHPEDDTYGGAEEDFQAEQARIATIPCKKELPVDDGIPF